ncbi:MAG TPA: flagellar basal body P-ring formation chaperone FlgA [Ramlibacter sp.]|jgi:flagella basal body P-ring formation protein FlgA|uniref:flagellar basal body P-ring formation chaperone FlgA n=1 Tax=Ramlibacter sp. TaxID=1917967 RepID=UPI002D6351C7|nr:flagellar basal body P-ring formation chaperone FlgA [Ramlibacter sp.]HZY18574.1 flagellar basal body P-ring formation chaperone FlgA [Ramlibacter sp.]
MRLVPFLFLLAGALAGGARAQLAPPLDENVLRAFVSQQVATAAPQLTRFDVQFASVTPRADLAACARTEPFLPAGARPWGRLAVGVRCVEGAAWTLMVPVTVRAWGIALVAAAPLAAGTVPTAQDVREQEVELTREPAAVLREVAALQGRGLTRPVGAGQPLRPDMLRAVPVVQAGDPVRLRIAGTGFSVTASGQALTAAAEGQPLRVRTELGRVLTGIAREGRLVDVAL